MGDRLPLEPLALAALCRRHGIRKLSLFGSALKGTAKPESDIDLLVEFEESARPSLFDMAQIEMQSWPKITRLPRATSQAMAPETRDMFGA